MNEAARKWRTITYSTGVFSPSSQTSFSLVLSSRSLVSHDTPSLLLHGGGAKRTLHVFGGTQNFDTIQEDKGKFLTLKKLLKSMLLQSKYVFQL